MTQVFGPEVNKRITWKSFLAQKWKFLLCSVISGISYINAFPVKMWMIFNKGLHAQVTLNYPSLSPCLSHRGIQIYEVKYSYCASIRLSLLTPNFKKCMIAY